MNFLLFELHCESVWTEFAKFLFWIQTISHTASVSSTFDKSADLGLHASLVEIKPWLNIYLSRSENFIYLSHI